MMNLKNSLKTVSGTFLTLILWNQSIGAMADEVSLVQGLYQKSKVKDRLSTSVISFGARYAKQFSSNMFWYADGMLGIKNYSSAGELTPDNKNDLKLGGGVRMYLEAFSNRLTPYVSGGASYQSISSATQNNANSMTESEDSGIFYGASVGIRFSLSKDFFLDLEAPLFTSALNADRKSTTTNRVGGVNQESKSSENRQELFIDSKSAFSSLEISLGMRI